MIYVLIYIAKIHKSVTHFIYLLKIVHWYGMFPEYIVSHM